MEPRNNKRLSHLVISFCLILSFMIFAWAIPMPVGDKLEYFARIAHKSIDETSGITPSKRYPGLFWVHNDSGDKPRIFAINKEGNVIGPESTNPHANGEQKDKYKGLSILGTENIDWECVTMLGDTLVIGDVGNNSNNRRDLALIFIKEPNPYTQKKAHILRRITVAYPEQEHFPPLEPNSWKYDCESLFSDGDQLYMLTKERASAGYYPPATSTSLYRVDKQELGVTNPLTFVGRTHELGGWVTDAEVSPDGRTLAVLCERPVQSIWLFERPSKGDNWLSGPSKRLIFYNAGQCEAITWEDAKHIVFANEDGDMYRVNTKYFRSIPHSSSKQK